MTTNWSTLTAEERKSIVNEVLAPPPNRIDIKAYNERLRRIGMVRSALLSQVDAALAHGSRFQEDKRRGQSQMF